MSPIDIIIKAIGGLRRTLMGAFHAHSERSRRVVRPTPALLAVSLEEPLPESEVVYIQLFERIVRTDRGPPRTGQMPGL